MHFQKLEQKGCFTSFYTLTGKNPQNMETVSLKRQHLQPKRDDILIS